MGIGAAGMGVCLNAGQQEMRAGETGSFEIHKDRMAYKAAAEK